MQTIRRLFIPLLALLALALVPGQAIAAHKLKPRSNAVAPAAAFDYSAQAKKLTKLRYETEKQVIPLPAYDGEVLYIEVTKPKAAGHWPTILEASPYHGTIADREGTRILPGPEERRRRADRLDGLLRTARLRGRDDGPARDRSQPGLSRPPRRRRTPVTSSR